jgi:hypothetical protein
MKKKKHVSKKSREKLINHLGPVWQQSIFLEYSKNILVSKNTEVSNTLRCLYAINTIF